MSPELLSSSPKETSGRVSAELADRARDQRMEWRGGGEADSDAADLAARGAAGADLGMLGLGQDRLGIDQERAAGVGQADAARMADEQRRVDLALERADLLAERRLLHMQLLGRAGDVALMRDGDEIAEVAKFHGATRAESELGGTFWRSKVLAALGMQTEVLKRLFIIYLNTG